jgi:hypothetical protein
MWPKSGNVYTARNIETVLTLRDTPFYRFDFQSRLCVLQTSHVGPSDLLSIPGFAETRWRFEGETREWIPLFRYVSPAPITDFVDIEHDIEADDEYWATPKGFPREQPTPWQPHYEVSGEQPYITSPARHFQGRSRRSRPH